jgi:hypothetical protein
MNFIQEVTSLVSSYNVATDARLPPNVQLISVKHLTFLPVTCQAFLCLYLTMVRVHLEQSMFLDDD